jgi:hypothetical protein
MPLKPLKSVGRNVGTKLTRSSETAHFRQFLLDDGDPLRKPYGRKWAASCSSASRFHLPQNEHSLHLGWNGKM